MKAQDPAGWAWGEIGPEGLRFYGKMSASISHEVKNVLAIVNENAGLLNDLVMMAERGMEVEPQRLVGIAGTIGKQVRRADLIAKNLNRFAHSADHLQEEVDLAEWVELALALAARFASNRGVRLEFDPAPATPPVHTSPFFLLNLIWLGLDMAMELAGPDKTVLLQIEVAGERLGLVYGRLSPLADNGWNFVTDSRVRPLALLLGAHPWQDGKSGRFGFDLPRER